jgi:hypothetical protein
MTDTLTHEDFCLPRPGETAPRIETYRAEQSGPDTGAVINRPLVTRCVEGGTDRDRRAADRRSRLTP